MKITCIKCDKEFVTMGAHYEQNFKGKEDEYVCLRCNSKVKNLPLPSCPVAMLLCGEPKE